jgi:hypothetical protein
MIGCIVIAMKTPGQKPAETRTISLETIDDTPASSVLVIPTVPEPSIIAEV